MHPYPSNLPGRRRLERERSEHLVHERDQAGPAGVCAEHDVEAERPTLLLEEGLVRALPGDAPPQRERVEVRESPARGAYPGFRNRAVAVAAGSCSNSTMNTS